MSKISNSFIIVLIIIFLNASGGMLPILGTLLFSDIGLNIETIGIVMSFFGVGSFLGGYVGGHLADYTSSKKIVCVSILGNAIFIMLYALLESVILFSVCMFFIGFFNSSCRPSTILLLFETMGDISKTSALSFRRVVLNLGFSASSAGFGFLYYYQGKLAFIFIGFVFLLNFVVSLFLPNNKPDESAMQNTGLPKNSSPLMFILLNFLLIISVIILDQSKTTYTFFLKDFINFSVLDISLLFTIHGILVLVFQIPIGFIFDKINIALGCFIGSILLAIGMGLTSLAINFPLAILFCTLWTFSEMILFPLLLPYLLNTSVYKKGKTMGIYQASFSFGGFLAPIFGSILYSYSSSLLWSACLVISMICAGFFLTFYKFYEPNVESQKIGSSV